jgi:hypothetical protein
MQTPLMWIFFDMYTKHSLDSLTKKRSVEELKRSLLKNSFSWMRDNKNIMFCMYDQMDQYSNKKWEARIKIVTLLGWQ